MPSPLAGTSYHIVESIDEAMEMKRWLGQRRVDPIGVDTETGGLSPERNRLRLIQFGDAHTGWAVPWERWGGAALEILNAYDGEWVAHNSIFDWRFIERHTGFELPWHKLHDTLTLARIDDPTRSNGLKPLAKTLVDVDAVIGQRALDHGMRDHGWNWDTVPESFGPYWQYAAMDPVLTVHLHRHFRAKTNIYTGDTYSLERAANRICTLMMKKGMQLDVPYVEESIKDFDAKAGEIRDWLKSAHKIHSPKSSGQIERAFENLGQPVKFWTNKGAPQFDKEALAWYEKQGTNGAVRQLSQLIRAVRHIEDIRDRYSTKFLELRDADDIVHCNINVMGARTSRMSVSDPALQQLPRDDKVIRGSFIPRPGHVFISCDLDQVEMRVLAHLSQDPGLIKAFLEADNGGADFFTAVAQILYREPSLLKADPRRQLMKNSMYARAYGSGPENLALTAGVTIDEVRILQDLTDTRFPGMKTLMTSIEAQAKAAFRRGQRGGVALASGRFLPCDKGREYATLNYLIQGTAAEYMKRCLVNLDNAGLTQFLVLPIHDECLLEVPANQAEDILKTVEDCMTDRKNFLVPLTAGGAVLRDRWAKAA